jgi:hypothetical protein
LNLIIQQFRKPKNYAIGCINLPAKKIKNSATDCVAFATDCVIKECLFTILTSSFFRKMFPSL